MPDTEELAKNGKRMRMIIGGCLVLLFVIVTILTVLAMGGPRWPISKYHPGDGPRVIIVSVDGLALYMLDRKMTPFLTELANHGVLSPMRPAYPSLTFPNHYTMMTGLFPAHHGIVANRFLDPVRNDIFYSKNPAKSTDGSWLSEGEPFWNKVERDGGKSAVVQWMGGPAVVKGLKATYVVPYDRDATPAGIVDKVIGYLKQTGPGRPNFIAAYISDVDRSSHTHGPKSDETIEALKLVDKELRRLHKEIKSSGHDVNFVVVSDHGFAELKAQDRIKLSKLLPDYSNKLIFASCSPLTLIYPKPGETEAVYQELIEAVKPLGGKLAVYKREETPTEWHYRDNPRIAQIIIQAVVGSSVECDLDGKESARPEVAGDHGYDPVKNSEMTAVFIAKGPAFKSDTQSFSERAGQNTDIPSMADVFRVLSRIYEIPVRGRTDSEGRLGERVLKGMLEIR